jgi:hypothetical protein
MHVAILLDHRAKNLCPTFENRTLTTRHIAFAIELGFSDTGDLDAPGTHIMKLHFRLALAALFALSTITVLGHSASGIVVDDADQIFFVHSRVGVAKIEADGKLTYIHRTTGGHWMCLDTDGRFSDQYPRLFQRLTVGGAKGKAAILFADGGAPIAVCADGNLYYGSGFPGGDDMAPGGHTITRLTPEGNRTLFSPELKTTLARMNEAVTGLAAGPGGQLYVACPNAILRLKMDGTVTTVAHPVVVPDCDNDVSPTNQAAFYHAPYLRGLAVADDGTVYAAVTGCHSVVKVAAGGTVTTILKAERPWSPQGVAVRNGSVYVLEYKQLPDLPGKPEEWEPRVRKLAADGKVTTLATVTLKSGKHEKE